MICSQEDRSGVGWHLQISTFVSQKKSFVPVCILHARSIYLCDPVNNFVHRMANFAGLINFKYCFLYLGNKLV